MKINLKAPKSVFLRWLSAVNREQEVLKALKKLRVKEAKEKYAKQH